MTKKTTLYFDDKFHKKLKMKSVEEGTSMTEIVEMAVNQYLKTKKEENKMKKAKIIDVVKLNENGVNVEEAGNNPMPVKYFDDNGGLPDGNFNPDSIAGEWILIEGCGLDELKADVEYAYRTIDNTLMIKKEDYNIKNEEQFFEILKGENKMTREKNTHFQK